MTKIKLTTRREADRQAKAAMRYFDKFDAIIRKRYFPDPVAWEVINAQEVDIYCMITCYACYRLACEMENKKPMTYEVYSRLSVAVREEITEQAYLVVLPDEVPPW